MHGINHLLQLTHHRDKGITYHYSVLITCRTSIVQQYQHTRNTSRKESTIVVCVCVCGYIYICMYICMYVCPYVCLEKTGEIETESER